jgi:transposase
MQDGWRAPVALHKRNRLAEPRIPQDTKACRSCGWPAWPPAIDASRYRQRNTGERPFSKRTQFRAVTIRFDKRKLIYQDTVDVASIRI